MARTKQKTQAKAKQAQTHVQAQVQPRHSDCTPIARFPAAPNTQVGGDLPPQGPVAVQSSGEEGTPLTWDRAFQLYEDHLHARRYSRLTIYAQQRRLIHLRDALTPEAATPADVTLDQLRRYQLALLKRRLSAATVANASGHVRKFFRFLYLEELLTKDPAERLERPKVPPPPPGEVLTPKEAQLLLEATAEDEQPFLARALVETLYCTGVRRSELLGLELGDLNHRQRTLFVQGKGEKPRVLPVVPTCYEALVAYLEHGRPEVEREPTAAFFLGQRGGRLAKAQLARLLRRLQERAGLSKVVSPHVFRRSCATGLLNNGTNLKVIQTILGHANLETTSVYLCLSPEEVRGEVLSRHPRERFEV